MHEPHADAPSWTPPLTPDAGASADAAAPAPLPLLPPAASDRVGPPETPAVFAPPADTWRRISPKYATVRRVSMSITLGILAALTVGAAWFFSQLWWVAAIPLGAFLVWWLWLWVRARRVVAAYGYAERDADLCVTKGLWFKELIVVPFGRMQVVKVSSGPLMRAYGLATVQLVTASAQTDATIPGLPLDEARVLRDRLIELSDAKGSGLWSELPEPVAGRAVIEERMHPLSPLVSVWVGVVAVAWFAFNEFLQGSKIFSDLSRFGENVPWYLWVVLGGVLVFLVFSYWSWWTTKFVIDDTELRIENTGAFQESKRIAFSRIQSVDISQPLAARLLGLAELRIDVGADAGTKLSYLSRSRAAEIRDYLMKRAHGRSASTSEASAAASVWNDLSTDDQVLIRLTPGELAAATVLSVEFLMTLLVLSVPLVIAYGFGLPELLVGTGFIPILLALGGIVSTRLIGQFNYTLARTDAGLRITRGLFTLRSQTVPAHRVQAIRISQPLPWRWLNRARLDVTVLGLGGGEGEETTTTILLPTGNPRQVQVALAAVWPGLRLEELTFQGPPRQARWLSPLQFRWMGYALDDQVVVSRRGWIIRAQHIVPHARLQSAALHQGPLQRRLGLATVKLHTTNLLGTEAIVHVAQDAARWLVYTEMDRARAARTGELIDPPGLRAPAELVADATPPDTLWTPPTSVAAAPADVGRIVGEGAASDLPR